MFGKKTSIVVTGKFNKNTDFDAMCDEISRESGCKVWVVQRGDTTTMFTNGDPEEVKDTIFDMAVNKMMYMMAVGIIQEMRRDAKNRMN